MNNLPNNIYRNSPPSLMVFFFILFLSIGFFSDTFAQDPRRAWSKQTKGRREIKRTFKKKKKEIYDRYSKLGREIQSEYNQAKMALDKEEAQKIEEKKKEITESLRESGGAGSLKNPYLGIHLAIINKGKILNAVDRIKEDTKRKDIALKDKESEKLIANWTKKNAEVEKMAKSIGFYDFPVPQLEGLVKPPRMKAEKFEKRKNKVKKSFLKDSTRNRREFLVFEHYRTLNELRWKIKKTSRLKGIELKLSFIKEKEGYALDLMNAIKSAKPTDDPVEQKKIADEISRKYNERALKMRNRYNAAVKELDKELKREQKKNQDLHSKKLKSDTESFKSSQEQLLK